MPKSRTNSSRKKADDDYDYYGTHPWAVRAALEKWIELADPVGMGIRTAFDPCVGQGHMLHAAQPVFGRGISCDIKQYGSYEPTLLHDFLDLKPQFSEYDVVMNPPYNKAEAFVTHALKGEPRSLHVLARLQFLEGAKRTNRLWLSSPPSFVLVYANRVKMGRHAPKEDPPKATAAHAWFVWDREAAPGAPQIGWITGSARTHGEHGDYYETV